MLRLMMMMMMTVVVVVTDCCLAHCLNMNVQPKNVSPSLPPSSTVANYCNELPVNW